jgi:valine--pyruvate aminotransferase
VVLLQNNRNSRTGPVEWEARNDGLRLATGEFVAYLDADNTWDRRFVARLSACLLEEPDLQLVCCRSINHYSAAEAAIAIATDPRRLVASGHTWTVFANGALARDRLGLDQYIDTNEMMHRTSALCGLTGLWNTRHPRRDQIQRQMRSLRRHRRHNDLDLVERIMDAYGLASVRQLDDVLVQYHYGDRPPAPIATPGADRTSNLVHPQVSTGLGSLNLDHFYSAYATPRPQPSGYDLGLGEVEVSGLNLTDAFEAFIAGGGVRNLLTRYNGSAQLAKTLAVIGEHYGHALQLPDLDERHLVPFDGCHEALSAAIGLFTGTVGGQAGRDTVCFAVPAYPYWAIAAAGRHRPLPLEAYSIDEYLDALERIPAAGVGAVVLNWPGNPLGYIATVDQVNRLNALARDRGWGIVADVTYQHFLDIDRESFSALAPERTVYCESASKAWGLPGLRLGFAVSLDPNLAAMLRATKSGRSLLPSGVKMAFLAWLMDQRPEIPDRIKQAVHGRRRRFRERWRAAAPTGIGLQLASEASPGLYEVLRLDPTFGLTSSGLADVLQREAGIRIFPQERFFPPRWRSTTGPGFVRLSLGTVENVEGASDTLLFQLRRLQDGS